MLYKHFTIPVPAKTIYRNCTSEVVDEFHCAVAVPIALIL
jgi:hypothetical protein